MKDKILDEINKEYRELKNKASDLRIVRDDISIMLKTQANTLSYTDWMKLECKKQQVINKIKETDLIANGMEDIRNIIFNMEWE